jgi:hypothetical protein
VVAPGGRLYLSTPVGRPRICFNAHRVFDPEAIVAGLPSLTLAAFSMVSDQGHWIADTDFGLVGQQEYACGCFEFINGAP